MTAREVGANLTSDERDDADGYLDVDICDMVAGGVLGLIIACGAGMLMATAGEGRGSGNWGQRELRGKPDGVDVPRLSAPLIGPGQGRRTDGGKQRHNKQKNRRRVAPRRRVFAWEARRIVRARVPGPRRRGPRERDALRRRWLMDTLAASTAMREARPRSAAGDEALTRVQHSEAADRTEQNGPMATPWPKRRRVAGWLPACISSVLIALFASGGARAYR